MSCEVTCGAQHENTPAVDAHGMPVRFFITDATIADCSIAEALITEFQAEYLLADRG